MKKLFLIVALLTLCTANTNAQWVSPGVGNNYSLSDLVSISDGVVTSQEEGMFHINADLTIATNDVLTIDGSTEGIVVADQVIITIAGTLRCDVDSLIMFTGNDPCGNSEGHYNLLFDNAVECHLKGLHLCQGGGIKLIESEVHFEDCRFSAFNTQYTSQVINYFHCNPIIERCYFHDNDGAAVGSAANITGSPKILHSIFFNNVLNNTNTPQINLGPGAEDSILIVGNHVEGYQSDRSGGIAITDLMGTGTTKARISDNVVVNNRYGFTQQGYDINTLIYDNIFSDNNLETDPMNGGSGISIFGYDNRCLAKARRNLISGNLWGITAIMNQSLDLGTADDHGENVIYGNGNNGISYELYNNSSNDLSAIGNYWGSNDESHAEAVIYHNYDDATLGTVTFSPTAELHPHFISFTLRQTDNTSLPHDIIGVIDQDNLSITLNISQDIDLSNIVISYDIPLGITADIESEIAIDLTSPTPIILSTPHEEQLTWMVIAQTSTAVEQHNTLSSCAFPNPASGNNIVVTFHNEDPKIITMRNNRGQIVFQHTTTEAFLSLEAEKFTPGLYILTINNINSIETLKIIF